MEDAGTEGCVGDAVNIESGVAILFALRRRGFSIQCAADGGIQVSPFNRLKDTDKKMIVANKLDIIAALAGEVTLGAQLAEKKARALLKEKNAPHVLATDTNGEWTYVSILRRNGMGWTIRIPKNQFDAFRLTQALLKVDKELVIG